MAFLSSELFLEFVVLALSAGFWFAAAPASFSRDFSPAELIASELPGKTNLKNAGKADLLAAVCAAARKHRASGVGLTSAAVAARGEFAAEIVGTVLRCARRVDCEYVGAITQAAVSARPAAAGAVSDAAMARAPNCGETIEVASRPATRRDEEPAKADSRGASEPNPETGSEREFDPHEQLSLVCDDGTPRLVRKSELDDFRHAHAAAVAGPCRSTPTPAPSVPAARR